MVKHLLFACYSCLSFFSFSFLFLLGQTAVTFLFHFFYLPFFFLSLRNNTWRGESCYCFKEDQAAMAAAFFSACYFCFSEMGKDFRGGGDGAITHLHKAETIPKLRDGATPSSPLPIGSTEGMRRVYIGDFVT